MTDNVCVCCGKSDLPLEQFFCTEDSVCAPCKANLLTGDETTEHDARHLLVGEWPAVPGMATYDLTATDPS